MIKKKDSLILKAISSANTFYNFTFGKNDVGLNRIKALASAIDRKLPSLDVQVINLGEKYPLFLNFGWSNNECSIEEVAEYINFKDALTT